MPNLGHAGKKDEGSRGREEERKGGREGGKEGGREGGRKGRLSTFLIMHVLPFNQETLTLEKDSNKP